MKAAILASRADVGTSAKVSARLGSHGGNAHVDGKTDVHAMAHNSVEAAPVDDAAAMAADVLAPGLPGKVVAEPIFRNRSKIRMVAASAS